MKHPELDLTFEIHSNKALVCLYDTVHLDDLWSVAPRDSKAHNRIPLDVGVFSIATVVYWNL